MVKAEVTETFTFRDFDKVQIVQKKSTKKNEFQKGDIFICDNDIAKYLSGENALNKNVIKILEVTPHLEGTLKTYTKEEAEKENIQPEIRVTKEEPKKGENTPKPKKKKIDKKVK